jgi:hypothetical protein
MDVQTLHILFVQHDDLYVNRTYEYLIHPVDEDEDEVEDDDEVVLFLLVQIHPTVQHEHFDQ